MRTTGELHADTQRWAFKAWPPPSGFQHILSPLSPSSPSHLCCQRTQSGSSRKTRPNQNPSATFREETALAREAAGNTKRQRERSAGRRPVTSLDCGGSLALSDRSL